MAFDPDAYLQRKSIKDQGFDPDKYLRGDGRTVDFTLEQQARLEKERAKEATPISKAVRKGAKFIGAPVTPYSEMLEKEFRGGDPAGKQLAQFTGKTTARLAPLAVPLGKGKLIGQIGKGALAYGIGGTAEKLIEGEKLPEALKAGKEQALSAGVAIGAVGGLGKIATSLGKKIIKGSIEPQFSERVTKKVLDNVGLTKKSRQTFADLAKRASRRTQALKKVFGKAVGKGKADAIKESALVDVSNVKRSAAKLIRESKIGVPKGVKAIEPRRMKVLKDVFKQLDKGKMSADDALTTLQNMDDALANTYTRRAQGAAVTTAEKTAQNVRRLMKDETNKTLGKMFQGSKKNYIEIMNTLDANNKQLAKGLSTPDKAQALIKKALKEGNDDLLRNLEKLDKLMPKEGQRWLTKSINKAVSSEIGRSARIRPGWRVEGLMDLLAPVAAAGLRAGEKIRPVTAGIKRIAARRATE